MLRNRNLVFIAVLVLLPVACNMGLPTCDTASLQAPALVSPVDLASVNTLNPTLEWSYPDPSCNPQGYRIDLSTDSTFADTSLSGGTGNPSTTWGPGSALADCTTYYWRVAGINDTTLGPFSGSRSFSTNASGLCAMPASASISGVVWDDQCELPDAPLPEPLPAGCIADPAGGAKADGIRQPGEPGIAGVEVDLHWGGCATVPVASVLTDASGHYEFAGLLTFGSYCLAVRALEPPNDSVLIPGEWTFPFGTTGADAFANATVSEGETLTDKDFGWDYQFGASSPTATPTPAVSPTPVAAGSPKFVLEKNAFCRKGPSQVFPDVTAIEAGQTLDILGRNEDSGVWYYILWPAFNTKCWVSASTGHPLGDLNLVPIMVSPPTPVPTAPPTSTPLKP